MERSKPTKKIVKRTDEVYPQSLSKEEIIEDPLPGTVVTHSGWSPDKKLPGYPCDVYILHGHYKVDGRVSNFWHWKKVLIDKKSNITLGPEETGYGSFRESKKKYNIEIIVTSKK